jgi:hypothetical protein
MVLMCPRFFPSVEMTLVAVLQSSRGRNVSEKRAPVIGTIKSGLKSIQNTIGQVRNFTDHRQVILLTKG